MHDEKRPDIESLKRQLEDVDEERRHQAALVLPSYGEAALPLLRRSLGDESWRVRKASIEAVTSLPGESAIALLLEGLRDEGNAGLRNTCIEALVRLGEMTLPHLEPLLGDPNADLRKFAVDILGSFEGTRVADLLMEALGDDEENVSAAAAEYLGRLGDRRAVPRLIDRLAGGGYWLRYSCLRALGELGDPAAAPAVLDLLGEERLYKPGIETLGKIGGRESVAPVIEALFSSDRGARHAAVAAAAQLHARLEGDDLESLRAGIAARAGDDLRAFLEELLGRGPGPMRTAAITLLACTGAGGSLTVLLDFLSRAEEEEQELVERALLTMPDEQLPSLFPSLRSPDPALRRRIAVVLGERECEAAVPHLIALLQDEDGHVRAAAGRALGAIGVQAAVAPLAGLLSDEYPDVREAGVNALGSLGRRSDEHRQLILNLLEAHLDSAEEELVANALQVIGYLGHREGIERLRRFLRDERTAVRRAAVQALGTLGEGAAEALGPALTDEDAVVRREVVASLGRAGGPGVFSLLVPMLQDEDLWVRMRAVQAIAETGDPGAGVVLLGRAAEEPPGPVRLAAVRAVGSYRVPGAGALLASLAGSSDRETRAAAIEALGELGDPAAVETLLACLDDPDWGLRIAAVKSLKVFADKEPVRAALSRAAGGDADQMVRAAAAETLGHPGE